jgi:hypothetical protein
VPQAIAPVDIFEIGDETALPDLYVQCVESLRDPTRIVKFIYPEELRALGATDVAWSSQARRIRELNEESLLRKLEGRVNCYAIHTRKLDEEWRLRYIGQIDCKRAQSGIARNLIPSESQVNAVFARCRDAVRDGCEIGLRLIKVQPDTLRFFIQEKLLNELRDGQVLDWNNRRY